ncbi:NAD(P)H-dependent oxidoreductase [Metasolibacillus meyeri]|uniref:NAD(P)H-dependent oxidoreductase n=1 Tax=Metasolibacillus meyeri TaxID=1071052 RepID=UPI000D30B4F8|nr:NAD(P)H-dependent oxidoreductase [Metasolibacillus meyeri]
MKSLVIVAHPDLSSSRINAAWVNALQHQSNITVHQLYDFYADENINIQYEQTLLEAHERIIFQYPLYWYSSPPLLKKWFDSVLQPGWAYGPDGDKMKGKEIGIAISTYGAASSYQPDGFNRFTIHELLRPVEALTHYISATYLPPFVLNDISNISDTQLEQNTKEYINYISSAIPAAS